MSSPGGGDDIDCGKKLSIPPLALRAGVAAQLNIFCSTFTFLVNRSGSMDSIRGMGGGGDAGRREGVDVMA